MSTRDSVAISLAPIRFVRPFSELAATMSLMTGAGTATVVQIVCNRGVMSRWTSSATRIWTTMVIGGTIRVTATFGLQESPSAGLLTTTAAGYGFRRGAGRG